MMFRSYHGSVIERNIYTVLLIVLRLKPKGTQILWKIATFYEKRLLVLEFISDEFSFLSAAPGIFVYFGKPLFLRTRLNRYFSDL